MKRKTRNKIIVWTLALAAAAILVGGTIALVLTAGTWKAQIKKSQEKICNKGWECSGSKYCCNDTITDFFKVYQFENLFAKRNTPVAHAVGFWDYQAFIIAAALFEPQGFCTTGGKQMQMMELCAFLGHVGAKTSCKILASDACSSASILLGWRRNRLIDWRLRNCRWVRRGYRRADGVGAMLQPRDEPRPDLL